MSEAKAEKKQKKPVSDEVKKLRREIDRLTKALSKMEKERDKYWELAMENDSLFGCHTCDKLFTTQDRLLKHEKTKLHANNVKIYREKEAKKRKKNPLPVHSDSDDEKKQ